MLATDDTFFFLSDSKILKKVSTLPVYLIFFSILWGILFLDFDFFLILVCFLKEK